MNSSFINKIAFKKLMLNHLSFFSLRYSLQKMNLNFLFNYKNFAKYALTSFTNAKEQLKELESCIVKITTHKRKKIKMKKQKFWKRKRALRNITKK